MSSKEIKAFVIGELDDSILYIDEQLKHIQTIPQSVIKDVEGKKVYDSPIGRIVFNDIEVCNRSLWSACVTYAYDLNRSRAKAKAASEALKPIREARKKQQQEEREREKAVKEAEKKAAQEKREEERRKAKEEKEAIKQAKEEARAKKSILNNKKAK